MSREKFEICPFSNKRVNIVETSFEQAGHKQTGYMGICEGFWFTRVFSDLEELKEKLSMRGARKTYVRPKVQVTRYEDDALDVEIFGED